MAALFSTHSVHKDAKSCHCQSSFSKSTITSFSTIPTFLRNCTFTSSPTLVVLNETVVAYTPQKIVLLLSLLSLLKSNPPVLLVERTHLNCFPAEDETNVSGISTLELFRCTWWCRICAEFQPCK